MRERCTLVLMRERCTLLSAGGISQIVRLMDLSAMTLQNGTIMHAFCSRTLNVCPHVVHIRPETTTGGWFRRIYALA